jgi:ribosomal protein S18 acetylase RimI-like enzyme
MNDNPPIAFRRAFDHDADFLYELHVATMKEYVDKTWGWDEAFQEAVFRKNYVPGQVRIITCDGRDMGMLVVEETPENIFLRAIEIHPDDQRRGIATGIINRLIADGRQKMKPVRLYVLKVNPAKGLYDRLGFSVIEETRTHYIMQTSIPE